MEKKPQTCQTYMFAVIVAENIGVDISGLCTVWEGQVVLVQEENLVCHVVFLDTVCFRIFSHRQH